MNILLLGKTDSIFTRDFCLNVLGMEHANTVILTQAFSKEYQQDYAAENIKEVKWPDLFLKGIRCQPGSIFRLPQIWKKLWQEIGFVKEIDVFHVHYVEALHLLYFFPFWTSAGKRILTFWGSDLYTLSFVNRQILRLFLNQASRIVLMIPEQHKYFQLLYGNKYEKKIRVIDFGNSLIDELDKVIAKYTKKECKDYFQLPADKVIVHIGYNAARVQQHLRLIEGILCLPIEERSRLKLVFGMSYKHDSDFEQYKQQLSDQMKAAKVDYCFVEKYMQGEELAMFRRTCDLFLYGQKTDARSESPLEYVYGGAEFICPEWLAGHYGILDQAKARYYVYEDFDNLSDSIRRCFENMDVYGESISEWGRQIIRSEISWDSVRGEWRSLYADE
ncbi:glycosyltransferase [Bacteroides caecimuris]|uniref:glycosyltransferase n=1 Tax=Bacteroides caecimuris TaxID=1796613 RepID=UPI0026653B27|nr:glycosyltransferase [Bacteroides caecimuris]